MGYKVYDTKFYVDLYIIEALKDRKNISHFQVCGGPL